MDAEKPKQEKTATPVKPKRKCWKKQVAVDVKSMEEIQKEELKIFVRQYNTDGIYVRYSPVQETLNYVSEYPSLTIYANGDLAIEETGDVIGNISTSEPAVEYKKYILEKWRTNK